MALATWLPHAFPGSLFINPLGAHIAFESSTEGDDAIYLEILLLVGTIYWNKLFRCWQIKDKNYSLLTINNYLLKHNGVTIIYTIYLSRKIVTFVVFERQIIKVFGWSSFSILLNFSKSEAFARQALILGEISFLIFLYLIWTLDSFSYLTLKTSIFIEDFPRNKHSWLANQSHIILYTFTTFWLVGQSNVLVYVCGKSIPSTYQILIGNPIKPQYRGLVN